ncbi:hypothetical protein BU25DRAFT_80267 [Macroventuria anomochaeta]|uniref:Uncharacterized protein n=1 Tax=Macroventuria anomochaeta TaxID=301207 RepID=A0ACB6SGH6_9PLEO|nr:uncharacterized protein BU25DRAFT_80267 [Macroventuria anomochaeta]KAF2632680.1 hypothetical protein BU25DRAFT_80267 [Macroventuria anomochaeta]
MVERTPGRCSHVTGRAHARAPLKPLFVCHKLHTHLLTHTQLLQRLPPSSLPVCRANVSGSMGLPYAPGYFPPGELTLHLSCMHNKRHSILVQTVCIGHRASGPSISHTEDWVAHCINLSVGHLGSIFTALGCVIGAGFRLLISKPGGTRRTV